MTSRERILAAVNHQPVDRIPIDFGGTRQTGISAFAYGPLRRRLGLSAAPFKVFDVYQMLAEIEQSVADRFGADCVCLNRPAVAFGIVNEKWKPYRLHDGTDVLMPGGFNPRADSDGGLTLLRDEQPIAHMPAGGFYFDRCEKFPGATHPDLATLEVPRLTVDELNHFAHHAKALYTGTDKAVVAALGPPYELFYGLGTGGFEDWMMTFASEDDYVRDLYEILVDVWIDNLRAFHEAVGDQVQILQFCDDFGTQFAPFLSTAMFREKLLPAYKRGLDWIHAHTHWKVLLHSDGAIYPLLDAIVEMGADILNPVQLSAAGMDAGKLKKEYGHKLAFWGAACDSQGALTAGTPQQVAAEVEANLRTFAPGSGLVLASVHNIQANVPADNIVAMFEAAREFSVA
jgi:uroporphyrinogen decarboxylase